MVRRVLSGGFWLASLAIVLVCLRRGGGALVVPGAVGAMLVLFLWDVSRHRELAAPDWDLVRTALHLLSGVAFAAASLYWLLRLMGP